MHNHHSLMIEGDEVTFRIGLSGQAMAVPEGGRTDAGHAFLGATVIRNRRKLWSGILSDEVDGLRTLAEQFTDQELERLYRKARPLPTTSA